jgi:hypothetical protein
VCPGSPGVFFPKYPTLHCKDFGVSQVNTITHPLQ